MPETSSDKPDGPDVSAIRHLVRLMKKYDLTALDVTEGQTKIRLRRQGHHVPQGAWTAIPAAPIPTPAPAAPTLAPAPTAAPAPAAPAAPTGIVIESPMVGTFYASMSPDVPPFVGVGAKIRPDMTVCIIEAMKVFTDIPAGVSGTIAEVLVKSGQPVEYGQPLFRVTPG